jgi:hypothetical protein
MSNGIQVVISLKVFNPGISLGRGGKDFILPPPPLI